MDVLIILAVGVAAYLYVPKFKAAVDVVAAKLAFAVVWAVSGVKSLISKRS